MPDLMRWDSGEQSHAVQMWYTMSCHTDWVYSLQRCNIRLQGFLFKSVWDLRPSWDLDHARWTEWSHFIYSFIFFIRSLFCFCFLFLFFSFNTVFQKKKKKTPEMSCGLQDSTRLSISIRVNRIWLNVHLWVNSSWTLQDTAFLFFFFFFDIFAWILMTKIQQIQLSGIYEWLQFDAEPNTHLDPLNLNLQCILILSLSFSTL